MKKHVDVPEDLESKDVQKAVEDALSDGETVVKLGKYTIRLVDIDTFGQDEDNANMGTPRGEATMDYSLAQFGAVRGIAVDRNNRVVAGNKTTRAAARSGIQKVIVIESEGDALVANKRTDFELGKDALTEEAALMDNRAGEIGLNWDADAIIRKQEQGADLSVMFYDDELARLLGQDGEGLYSDIDDDELGEQDGEVTEMDLQPFEHYDYVLLMFRNTFDWTAALNHFARHGLLRRAFTVNKKTRKIGLSRVLDGSAYIRSLRQEQEGR